VICPENFDEGPQILVSFILEEKPWRIFSATSFTVLLGLRITGRFLSGSFPGSFV